MVSAHLFSEISLILGVAIGMAIVMRLLRQPLIIGHILTGLIVGPVVLNAVTSTDVLRLFGEIGIAFLLFIVGLGLNPRVLKEFGKVAVLTGVGQVVFTSLAGLVVAMALGIAFVPALYVAVALCFSSTIIILKLISDKGDAEQLYAKIAIGFLLVQDFIAIILLFSVPLLAGDGSWQDLTLLIAKGVGLGALVLFVAFKILSRFDRFLSRSQELLFLFSTAWGIGIAAIFFAAGFSLESGALLAGIGLSMLPSRHEIASRMAPLRDFFLVLFFILLGMQISIGDVGVYFPAILAFSALILIGNPLILIVITGALGYRKKTSFETAMTVAQISEFSLVLVALGVRLGDVPGELLSVVTMVGLITIFGSSYMVLYSDRLYRRFAPYLGIFERRRPTEHRIAHKDHDVFLFGGSRVGFDFIELFRKHGKDFVVVDHDPDVIRSLEKEGVPTEYGDAEDIDFLDDLHLEAATLTVSTIPDLEANLLIMRAARRANERGAFVAVAHNIKDAFELYATGADYVILPHFLGGEHVANMISDFRSKKINLKQEREDHIRHLEERRGLGHEHPQEV